MEIWVILDGSGQIKTYPDRLLLRRGENVKWRFQASETSIFEINWTVYFEKRSPFVGVFDFSARSYLETRDRRNPITRQHLTTTAAKTIGGEPGEYKYGIRAIDPRNQETLADEDPYIIVL